MPYEGINSPTHLHVSIYIFWQYSTMQLIPWYGHRCILVYLSKWWVNVAQCIDFKNCKEKLFLLFKWVYRNVYKYNNYNSFNSTQIYKTVSYCFYIPPMSNVCNNLSC